MTNVVSLRRSLYEAKGFHATTEHGPWQASGTLCGHIDFVIPGCRTLCLSPDEVHAIVIMLGQARHDVLEHSDPYSDPRLVKDGATPA